MGPIVCLVSAENHVDVDRLAPVTGEVTAREAGASEVRDTLGLPTSAVPPFGYSRDARIVMGHDRCTHAGSGRQPEMAPRFFERIRGLWALWRMPS